MRTRTLSEALQAEHEAAMIRQATTIHNWPIPRERQEQAMIHVRLALWERGTGRISEATQYHIYSILHFAMPDDAAVAEVPPQLEEMEPESAIEAAYFEQLERQSCPECGDVLCPGDDT